MVNKTVLIVGAYGTGNIGDEAILSGILKYLISVKGVSNNEIVVFSRNPFETTKLHQITSRRKNLFDLILSDEVIIGGGELFQNQGKMAIKYSLLGIIAKIFRKELTFLAVGFSSNVSKLGKILARISFSVADNVSVRDKESMKRVLCLGVKKRVVVVPDPAFNVEPVSRRAAYMLLEKEGFRFEKGCLRIGFVSQFLGNNELYFSFLRFLKEILNTNSDIEIFFIPFTSHVDKALDRDLLYGEWLKRKINNDNFKVLKNTYKPQQIMGIIGLMDLVVSTRFHPLVFATKMNVPAIGMDLFDKTRSFCKSHDIPLVKLNELDKIPYLIQNSIHKN
ncbi:MAG: polysaccharide pyruvyl transferase family protein [Candidatus Bathyarchaeota archaeon]|nr:polysaccharide pyruvyl transferase family protein [Candidatus Bathyarchaeum tardum]